MDKQLIDEAITNLVTHLHSKNYEGIIISGHTNQVSTSLIKHGWELNFGSKPLPPIFAFDGEANSLLYKSDLPEEQRLQALSELIHNKMPGLESKKQALLCYVDETILSGYKYEALRERFKQLGFKHVDFAFFAGMESNEYDNEVYIGIRNNELAGKFVQASLETHGFKHELDEARSKFFK